jgi:hypothetical protein
LVVVTGNSRLWIWLRAIPIGWAALGLFVFLVERPLLRWTAPFIDVEWIATVRLGLDCVVLVATGWVVGRLSRPSSMIGVLVFAVTLTLWDLSFLVSINVPWLFRLVVHVLGGDGSYLSGLISTAASQALLFASLAGGGLLSRPAALPVSIRDKTI